MPTLQKIKTDIVATIKGPAKGGKMMDEKKLIRSFSFLTINESCEPVEVGRLLIWGTPARSYASVWLKVSGDWRAGHGHAGGYGYHRPSAAAQKALEAAGIAIDQDIGGMGDSRMVDAVGAALLACGVQGPIFYLQAY